MRFETLKTRKEFLAAAKGRRFVTDSMVVQARKRGDDSASVRVGFTCSKKVGNAVVRNRAKRRLREVARQVVDAEGRSGWDYVLIGRAGRTATLPFETMKADLVKALRKLHSA